MRLAYAKMRCGTHWGGTRILRHTAATRMLQHGASLRRVADVLGHCSIQTTTIYTKVDLRRLTAVASPWPEVRVMRKRPTMVNWPRSTSRIDGSWDTNFGMSDGCCSSSPAMLTGMAITDRWPRSIGHPMGQAAAEGAPVRIGREGWALFVASPSIARSSILTRRFHSRTPSVGGTAALLRISTAWRKSPPWWRLPASCLPRKGLRPHTYATLFGLLACTGLRLREALNLTRSDVDWKQGLLTIRQTKFRKSRLVPLHPTAGSAPCMFTPGGMTVSILCREPRPS